MLARRIKIVARPAVNAGRRAGTGNSIHYIGQPVIMPSALSCDGDAAGKIGC
jgi:hypothetical protein